VELATTAAAEHALDARERLRRMALEQHVPLVVHCRRVASEMHADASAVARALVEPRQFGAALRQAHRVAERSPCHAVALRGGKLPDQPCLQRFMARRMCSGVLGLSLPAVHGSADETLLLALTPAAAECPSREAARAPDAGELFRRFGVRAGPLFPDAPFEVPRASPAVREATSPRGAPTYDVRDPDEGDSGDDAELVIDAEPIELALADAIVCCFEQIVHAAGQAACGALTDAAAPPSALNLSHDVDALLHDLGDGDVRVVPVPEDLVGSQFAEELALCVGTALGAIGARAGFVRAFDDARDVALGLLARRAQVPRARMEDGRLQELQWPQLTQAAGALAEIPLTLAGKCRLECDAAEVAISMLQRAATVVVIDATLMSLSATYALRAELANAEPHRGSSLLIVRGAAMEAMRRAGCA
jgi:hypothetical protein